MCECLSACVHHMHECLKRPKENIACLRKGVTGICETLCDFQEQNPSSGRAIDALNH